MSELQPWAFELEEYILEGEPDQAKKSRDWSTAIGLQAVDGLAPSRYLLDTAREHIEGGLTIEQVQKRIASYYNRRSERTQAELENEEADIVSSRIAMILGEHSFTFSPAEWKSIHGRLFKGLVKDAGAYRKGNMTKKEWVLKGDTVRYASWNTIPDTVAYDFDQEGRFSYKGLTKKEIAHHVAAFASGIWQIHPFYEGNTRATAVFAIKYLNSMGVEVDNEPFAENSWYFRNALVRANYTNIDAGVFDTTQYLEQFFENAILGTSHELKNRFLHVDWVVPDQVIESDAEVTPQVAPQVAPQVGQLLAVLGEEEVSLREITDRLGLSDRKNVMKNYVGPALEAGLVERTVPDKPNSRLQKYRKKQA